MKKGQRVAFLSIVIILALTLLKAVVGSVFNSPLLIADAWHSGTDILINLSSLIGLKLASKKKSSRFPYGLYKAETIGCLLIGVLIVLIGGDLFQDGWGKFFEMGSRQAFPIFPMGASLVSCAVAAVLAVKQRAMGKAIGSQALLATSREAFFDIFTSLFVLVGIFCVYVQIPYVEGVIILLIAVLILKLGIETAWKSIMILMEADLDSELRIKIEKRLNQIPGVKNVSGVKIRQSGPFKIVNCIIRTAPSQTVYKSHEMADRAENMLLTEYGEIESVFIHMEPEKERIEIAAIPIQDKIGLESRLHDHFGRAPCFILVHLSNESIEVDSYMENEFLDKKGHIGLSVVKAMVDCKITVLFVSSIGEIAFHYLKNHYVDIFKVDEAMTVREIIRQYKKNKFDPIGKPGLPKQTF